MKTQSAGRYIKSLSLYFYTMKQKFHSIKQSVSQQETYCFIVRNYVFSSENPWFHSIKLQFYCTELWFHGVELRVLQMRSQSVKRAYAGSDSTPLLIKISLTAFCSLGNTGFSSRYMR